MVGVSDAVGFPVERGRQVPGSVCTWAGPVLLKLQVCLPSSFATSLAL